MSSSLIRRARPLLDNISMISEYGHKTESIRAALTPGKRPRGTQPVAITNAHLDLGAGRRGVDMGPNAIHVAGLIPQLRELGYDIGNINSVHTRKSTTQLYNEQPLAKDGSHRFLQDIKSFCEELRDCVHKDLDDGHFPLVLGGDHSVAMGTISGISGYYQKTEKRKPGVIWIDAHTDMNTPETSPSGNIHGMPLTSLLGVGHPDLVQINQCERSLDPENVVLFGIRDVDPTEVPLVEALGVRCITMSEIDARGFLTCAREAVQIATSDSTAGVHISLDMDGIDPEFAPGVGTAVPGGLSLREVHTLLELAAETKRLVGMEVVETNPTLDHCNKTAQLAVWCITSALGQRILGARPAI
eukprot:TRINITY_DN33565_c0_g1_i1.p1 TRINITY_DN33565_c0_g1~~TRINITY_DN33565_c0_g1_i1.p1  ORF type:complete len:358 (+),score=65.77 TRINITY_DN33565_c0_g1_i1:216-1289(+)